MEIAFDEFMKLELQVGTVVLAERVPGADKLYKLSVDMGSEKRTLVAGVAQQYSPEELVGRQIVVVANLAPRALRGIISQGMLLAAEGESGAVSILSPDKKVQNGSRVR
ncbi:TPA: methionine--tRNA ligase subunit beta [Candidatus Micrarchaeota archaeon]|nr:methionine--tRNA ligase subunit beta [Candidatus Micrarchaeota archaeon]HIH30111.1 methionine--tRNA ligase subunit beta [Candidatus Micrarchaeota archaeon]